MKKFEEKTLSSKKIFTGKVISLQVDDVELPDGKTGKREIIKHPGAVAVIALTSENKIIMVEQYRKALERSLVEIPAGKLEKGEEPVLSAKRELEEETGYEWENVAHNLKKKENAAPLDEDEFVEMLELTLEEAQTYMDEGKIQDAKTAYAVQYLQLKKAMTS